MAGDVASPDALYVSVDPSIWNDIRVRSLSVVARHIFAQLLICPQHSKVPSLPIQTGPGALREDILVRGTELLSGFEELQAAGVVKLCPCSNCAAPKTGELN